MLLLLLFALISGPDYYDALLFLAGAGTIEELSEEDMERYDNLAKHPIDINNASRSKLLSCGLFTRFQVASIVEYHVLDLFPTINLLANNGLIQKEVDNSNV